MDAGIKRLVFGAAQLGFVALAAIAVYEFVTVSKEGEHRRECTAECLIHPDYAGTDRTVPDFALKDMQGRDVKMSDYRGKVVVLNFWTRTCGPCLKEMPSLAELTHMLEPMKDVVVVAVSIDEGPADVSDTLNGILREKPPFSILFDPDGEGVVGGKFGTHLFPETWVIDKRGVVRARFDGGRDWANAAVVELLDQIRGGGYCPLAIDRKIDPGGEQATRFCEAVTGG